MPNRNVALSYLQNISYYHLSAYYLPFKHSEDFKSNIRFEDIISLYTFDRKLRLFVLDAIEPIEIALRSQVIYHLSHTYGAFGYMDAKIAFTIARVSSSICGGNGLSR